MRIKEAVLAVSIPTQILRFYELSGLIVQPRRDSNGYRTYAAPLDLHNAGAKHGNPFRELRPIKLTDLGEI